MFYVEVDGNKNLIVVEERTNKSIKIDDSIDNYDLYYFDTQHNLIIKRNIATWDLGEEDGNAVIYFKTDTYLKVNIDFNGLVGDGTVHAGRSIILDCTDGKAKLTVSTLLAGTIYIGSADERVHFEPIIIESETGIDNEHNPTITVTPNTASVEPSIDYNRFRNLQRDMEVLTEKVDKMGQVVFPNE